MIDKVVIIALKHIKLAVWHVLLNLVKGSGLLVPIHGCRQFVNRIRNILPDKSPDKCSNIKDYYEKNKQDNWILETVLEKVISRIAKEINERWGDEGVKAKIVKLDEENKTVYIKLNSKTEKVVVKNTEYWSDLKKALKVNGGLDAVNDKLAKLLKTYTLGHVVDKAENRINAYIDKASDYLTNLINKHLFTRAVAPIIIFETSTGVDRLCEGMFINRGVMHTYLTSGTMELLVPAYRKYIALEKNGMLLESAVLPGNTLTHDFDLNEKGDYKIIISCVDYFGYVITKKYNVHVK